MDSFSNTGGLFAGFLVGISMVPAEPCRSKREVFILWTLRIIGFIVLTISFVSFLSKFYGHNELFENGVSIMVS